MANTREAADKISEFLANRISLEVLEDWSALYLQSAYQSRNLEAQRISRQIRSILNAFEDDENDRGLRLELANATRRFDESDTPRLFGTEQVENIHLDWSHTTHRVSPQYIPVDALECQFAYVGP